MSIREVNEVGPEGSIYFGDPHGKCSNLLVVKVPAPRPTRDGKVLVRSRVTQEPGSVDGDRNLARISLIVQRDEVAAGGANQEEADPGAPQTRQLARGALQEHVVHHSEAGRTQAAAAAAGAFLGDGFSLYLLLVVFEKPHAHLAN